MSWKDLSIRDKAAVIREAVAGGNFNLADIRNTFDDGGPMWGKFIYDGQQQEQQQEENRPEELATYADKYPYIQYMEDMNQRYQNIRRDVDEQNRIPFIPEKQITLTNAGLSTGATISTNVLDSLAKYGARTAPVTHPYDAIGLAARETQLGLYPGRFLNKEQYNGQNQLVEKGFVTPVELTNDDKYYSTPYSDAIAYGAKKVGAITSIAGDSRVYYEPHPATDSLMNESMRLGRGYADAVAKQTNWQEHPLTHAFNLFNSGLYNTGEPEHSSKVREFGANVFNSPQVQKWWNEGGKDWYSGTQYENIRAFGGNIFDGFDRSQMQTVGDGVWQDRLTDVFNANAETFNAPAQNIEEPVVVVNEPRQTIVTAEPQEWIGSYSDYLWDPQNGRVFEGQKPIVEKIEQPQRKIVLPHGFVMPQRTTLQYDDSEFSTKADNTFVSSPVISEDNITDNGKFTEDVILGDKKDAINNAISKLKNGDELKEFQKELFSKGYYDNLPAPKITAKTKEEVMSLQRKLRDAGYGDLLGNYGEKGDGIDGKLGQHTRDAWAQYVKEHPEEAVIDTIADGKMGPATREAARKYYQDFATAIKSDINVGDDNKKSESIDAKSSRNDIDKIEKIDNDDALSFSQYLYTSGRVGALRRAGNVASVIGNYANGIIRPHSSTATMSEGARRQMVGASLEHMENTGKYGITDAEHSNLGGMEGHSGTEFRQSSSMPDYFGQMADAPYHNIYGQSGSTYNEETEMFSPGPDSYTFNNVWDGNKVIDVKEDGEGTGSIKDAYLEYKRAKESGASVKAAMESAASIRGVSVGPKKGKSNSVDKKKMERYEKEYQKYLTNERFRKRFDKKLEKLNNK